MPDRENMEKMLRVPARRLCRRASRLASLLFEQATDITIFHGQAVNHAHDSLDIDFDSKALLVKRLAKSLTEMGKNVKVSRC